MNNNNVFDYSREERRWIERENRGKRNKVKKEEMARIKNFVGE